MAINSEALAQVTGMSLNATFGVISSLGGPVPEGKITVTVYAGKISIDAQPFTPPPKIVVPTTLEIAKVAK